MTMMMLSGFGESPASLEEDGQQLLDALKNDATDKFRYELYCWSNHMSFSSMVAANKLDEILAFPGIPLSDKRVYERDVAANRNNQKEYKRLSDFAIQAQWEEDEGAAWAAFDVDNKCPSNPLKPSTDGLGFLPVIGAALVEAGAVKLFLFAVGAYVVVKTVQAIVNAFTNQEPVEDQIARSKALIRCNAEHKKLGLSPEAATKACRDLFPAPSPSFLSPIVLAGIGVGIWLLVKYKDDIFPSKSPSGASA